jgi:uncharacterized protein YndB with AHSA1/START domain
MGFVRGRPWRYDGSVEESIDAPPEAVYAAVADVTRTGERSPECHAAEWLPGAPPGTVGARFRGHNRARFVARWSRECEVVSAEPGRSFAFRTIPDDSAADSTTWSYTFEPSGAGTRVVHSYEITLPPTPLMRAVISRLLPDHTDMRPQMTQTLAALKASLEDVAGSPDERLSAS